jgi:putative transposase
LVETGREEIHPAAPDKAVGIDLGITHFAVLSTGEKVSNPKPLQHSISRLKVLQHRAARKKKGSSNRKKANLKIALLHEKITNQRNDFLHKLSTQLISDSQTDTICVETLFVKNMARNHCLAQAIKDASWGEFIRQLQYKSIWNGKNLIEINTWFPSSKICSACGNKYNKLELKERVWSCSHCHTTHDRDINAALNIKRQGLLYSGRGTSIEPVESPSRVGIRKQE